MPLPTTTFSPSKHFGFGKDDPSGKDLSWIGDVSDELVVRIALRDFESAVALVEKGTCARSACQNRTALNLFFDMRIHSPRSHPTRAH